MSEESLLRHCSPTLAGIKTGNILTCAYADAAAMRDSLLAGTAGLATRVCGSSPCAIATVGR